MFQRFVVALFALSMTTAANAAPDIRPAGIPAGYTMVSACIAGMGEHWANLKDLNQPIYGTANGRVIFSEIMIPLKQLQGGFNYPNMTALPGHTIDHVAIEWHPKGHDGMPIPHYDFHAYYISYTQQKAICPKGLPDPDGMKM